MGKYATVGYTEFLRRAPESTNSALVELLLDAGAVLYCKTNVPQTMMVRFYLHSLQVPGTKYHLRLPIQRTTYLAGLSARTRRR